MKEAEQVAERAVIRGRFGPARAGRKTMRGMIVLDLNGIASRIIPARMAPVDGSAAHGHDQQNGNRLRPYEPAEKSQ